MVFNLKFQLPKDTIMNTHERYALVPWPESQRYDDVAGCILVDPGDNDDLEMACLVPEDVFGPLADDGAYLRIGWPEAQEWDEAPEDWDEADVLHDYESADAFVLQPLYEEKKAA